MGAIIHKEIADGLRTIRNYIARFKYDGGSMLNSGETTRKFYKFLKDNNIPTPVFSWFGDAGYKPRTSGIYTFATKVYSLFGLNDATQTTAVNQPYLSGNIAPNEKICLKNPNGGSNYMTHPTISFAANEAWSVTTVLNWNGSIASSYFIGNSSKAIGVKYAAGANNNALGIISTPNSLSTVRTDAYCGKSVIYSFVYSIDNIAFYVNGILKQIINNQFEISFTNLIRGLASSNDFTGTISAHVIRAQALTTSQVAAEANFLRSIYPEIPSVTIGSQVWATSNCEMIATPQGNLIADVTDNATWASSQTLYDNTYAATSGTVEQKTYAAVKAAAMWRSPNNDVALQVIYGKIYNGFAKKLLAMDIAYYNAANPSATWGYGIPTQAELNTMMTTISDNAESLKAIGTTYWTTPNAGTNTTGMTLLPAGYIKEDGTYAGLGTTAIIGVEDDMDMPKLGTSLRLIKR